jgi:hypothetical protein
MNLQRYVLADPSATLPMPDRGGRLFSSRGETIDIENPFWSARIADGELITAGRPAANGSDIPPAPPAKRKGK